jgi:hypothetical protein
VPLSALSIFIADFKLDAIAYGVDAGLRFLERDPRRWIIY